MRSQLARLTAVRVASRASLGIREPAEAYFPVNGQTREIEPQRDHEDLHLVRAVASTRAGTDAPGSAQDEPRGARRTPVVTEPVLRAQVETHAEVPAALEDIIMKALSRRPSDRFETAQDLQLALERFVSQEAKGSPAGASDLAQFMKKTLREQHERWREMMKLALESDVGAGATAGGTSDLVVAVRPHALPTAATPTTPTTPQGSLPRTGGDTAWAVLAAALGVAGLAGRRLLRRTAPTT